MLIDDHCWGPWISVLLVLSHFPFRPCTISLNFPLLCALWGSDLWWIFFFREWSCSGAWVRPIPRQMMGVAFRCHWVVLLKWGKWCNLEAPPGPSVLCHGFSPASSTFLLRPLPFYAGHRWQVGKALLFVLWDLGTEERSHPCTAGIVCRGGSSCVRPVLCVWAVKVWGCCGTEGSHFLLDPSDLRHKWGLSQRGNALLVHIPLTVPSGLSLGAAALAWVPHLCTPCCCYLCYSQLSSCCQWQFQSALSAQRNMLLTYPLQCCPRAQQSC